MKTTKSHLAVSLKLKKSINGGDSIYLAGPTCCGKTELLKTVMLEEDHIYSLVDCNYFKNVSQFYRDILFAFNMEVEEVQDKIPVAQFSPLAFLELYEQYYKCVSKHIKGNKLFLILDDVEVLVELSMLDILIGLSGIETLALIMVANKPPRQLFNYISDPSARAQLLDSLEFIPMNPFSKEDIYEIVVKELPRKYEEVYLKYAQFTVTLLYLHRTINLLEIKAFCQQSFPPFIEFFNEEINQILIRKSNTYREDLFNDNLTQANAIQKFFKSYGEVSNKIDLQFWASRGTEPAISIGPALLVLAAFIAAYTRPSADKINFLKLQKKSKRLLSKNHENGPKEFTLERLINVFRGLSLVHKKEEGSLGETEYSDQIFSDILILEKLKIIHASVKQGLESTSRYRISSNLPIAFFQTISKQLDLDLEHFYGLPQGITSNTY